MTKLKSILLLLCVIISLIFLKLMNPFLLIPTIPTLAELKKPELLSWSTYPYNLQGQWINLPTGSGNLVINFDVKHTKEIRVYSTPTGTGTAKLKKLIGIDKEAKDGWSVLWNYPDEEFLVHIEVELIGETSIAYYFLFNAQHR